MRIRYTLWGSLYTIDAPQEVSEPWHDVVARFSSHLRTDRKDAAPGFGPYFLQMPFKACSRHADGLSRQNHHRCDLSVESLTLAVYDADTGTPAEVEHCDSLLAKANIARLWYSTYSHTHDKASFRLVIPLARPVQGVVWQDFRYSLLRRFSIPADPAKCTGLSHFYYLPSCPREATPTVRVGDGAFLEPDEVPDVARTRVTFASLNGFAWQPPEETGQPVDVAALTEELRRRANSLARKGELAKAQALRKLLAGEALAERGERNSTTFKVAGMLPWALPGEPLSTYRLLIRESVAAMEKAGSSLTLEKVERMLLTAMRNKAERDHLAKTTQQNQQRELEEFKQGIYRAAGLGG